ncbi:MAG: zinc metallopeptidase [Ruminococcaceae bacterium]|nr:zinc metallopeptidase [Oscillospiraceae bacterium]
MPFFYMDYWYLILVLPAVLISLIAQIRVKTTFAKYSTRRVASGMTGAEASQYIQQKNGIHTGLEAVAGELSDHFDPLSNTIRLSSGVYGQATVAAVGVAAHETGHALQHAQGYNPVILRTKLVPITNFASGISPILIILGILLTMDPLAYAGIALFSVVTLFQLVTLPVEFNASNRAIAALKESGRFTEDEMIGVRKVLTAAALTYVAALLVSVMTLLRFILLVSGNRRDD